MTKKSSTDDVLVWEKCCGHFHRREKFEGGKSNLDGGEISNSKTIFLKKYDKKKSLEVFQKWAFNNYLPHFLCVHTAQQINYVRVD